MTDKKFSNEKLEEICCTKINDKLIEIYDVWCKTYDTDTIRDMAYCGPSVSVDLFSTKLKEFGFSTNARILDLGAGTGMVGEALRSYGYTDVDAVDISSESLKVAKRKGVYKNLIQGTMATEGSMNLGVAADHYDAGICVGVFTGGHVRGKGFDDLVYAIKSGGLACFTIRDDVAHDPKYGYQEKMEELTQKGKWKLVQKVHALYLVADNLRAWLHIYQVL